MLKRHQLHLNLHCCYNVPELAIMHLLASFTNMFDSCFIDESWRLKCETECAKSLGRKYGYKTSSLGLLVRLLHCHKMAILISAVQRQTQRGNLKHSYTVTFKRATFITARK